MRRVRAASGSRPARRRIYRCGGRVRCGGGHALRTIGQRGGEIGRTRIVAAEGDGPGQGQIAHSRYLTTLKFVPPPASAKPVSVYVANPSFSVPHVLQTIALVRLGRMEEARSAAERVVNLDPTFAMPVWSVTVRKKPA